LADNQQLHNFDAQHLKTMAIWLDSFDKYKQEEPMLARGVAGWLSQGGGGGATGNSPTATRQIFDIGL